VCRRWVGNYLLGSPYGLASGANEIAMKAIEMSDGEDETEGIDEDPQEIDDVMTVRRLN